MAAKLQVAILIVSDTASKDASTDKCIPVLRETFAADTSVVDGQASERWLIHETKIVPDDTKAIQEAVKSWTDSTDQQDVINLVVTSGGTGFATADVTPEACIIISTTQSF